MSGIFGFDELTRKMQSIVDNARTVGDVIEEEANKMRDEAEKIAKGKGLEVTGAGVAGITTKSRGTEAIIGWSGRPNLHLYFHEKGWNAGFGKHTSRAKTGKRKRRYKKGSRVYMAPKPHIKPATLKLKDKAIRNIKKHILGG